MKNQKDYRLPPPSTFIPPELLKVKEKKPETKRKNAMTGEIILSEEERARIAYEKAPKYTLTLNALGSVTESQGVTMLEALKNLKKPDKITTKATIRISYEGKSKELYYTPTKLKRVFYPMAQELLAKSYVMDLKTA